MKRAAYTEDLDRLSKIVGSENVVYVDETGFQQHSYRPHAWALRGKKVYGDVSGNNRKCVNLILAKKEKTHFAPMLFDGNCDAGVFNTWLESVLIPCLDRPSLIIMDNAAFHKKIEIRAILQAYGHEVLFLPPYSPDMNPIENSFGTLKKIRIYSPSNLSISKLVKSFVS
jgi:transposase